MIDFHHHLLDEAGYADTLLAAMDGAGIAMTCLIGLGVGQGRQRDWERSTPRLGGLGPDNGDVLRAVTSHPDRFIGLGVVRLGRDGADAVDRLREQGFLGLKIARSSVDYDDDRCFPVYERAERLRLPILFHTGFQLLTTFDGEDDVSSARMRPILWPGRPALSARDGAGPPGNALA